MAVAQRGSPVSATSATNVTSLAIDPSGIAGLANNDILLAAVVLSGTGAVITPPTTNGTWNLLDDDTTLGGKAALYWRRTDGSEVSETWNWDTGSKTALAIIAYSGCHTTNAPQYSSGSNESLNGNTTTLTWAAITPSFDNGMLVALAAIKRQSSVSGHTGSLVEALDVTDGNGQMLNFAAKLLSGQNGVAQGPFTATIASGTARSVGWTLMLQPEPVVTPITVTATAGSTATSVRKIKRNISATAGATATSIQKIKKIIAATSSVTPTSLQTKITRAAYLATSAVTATSIQKIKRIISATAGSTASYTSVRILAIVISATAGSVATVSKLVKHNISVTSSVTATSVRLIKKIIEVTSSVTPSAGQRMPIVDGLAHATYLAISTVLASVTAKVFRKKNVVYSGDGGTASGSAARAPDENVNNTGADYSGSSNVDYGSES